MDPTASAIATSMGAITTMDPTAAGYRNLAADIINDALTAYICRPHKSRKMLSAEYFLFCDWWGEYLMLAIDLDPDVVRQAAIRQRAECWQFIRTRDLGGFRAWRLQRFGRSRAVVALEKRLRAAIKKEGRRYETDAIAN